MAYASYAIAMTSSFFFNVSQHLLVHVQCESVTRTCGDALEHIKECTEEVAMAISAH